MPMRCSVAAHTFEGKLGDPERRSGGRRDGAIPPRLLRLVERLVTSFNQGLEALPRLELGDAGRDGYLADFLAGSSPCHAGTGDARAYSVGDLPANLKRSSGQDAHQLFATVARGKIALSNSVLQVLSDHAQNLVADLMSVLVVEFLEMIDVDQENAQGIATFHRVDLG